MPELCEWNPVADEPAVLDGKQHIGCANEATLSVGRVHNWHLCSSCADLPKFKRMTKRTPLRNNPGK